MLNENLIKGQIIELKVQIELLRYGFDISIPNYNASKYDLIADTGNELLRIQVKKSISNSLSSFTFQCTSQNVRSTDGAKHKYTNDEIDYFATVWKDKVYLIPVDETSTQKTISFTDDTYLAQNVLSQYTRLSDEELYNSSHEGKFYCQDCGCEISAGATRCIPCNNKLLRKADRPEREELKKLIRSKSFLEIGRMYNVTDNAIRKWCDNYNLPRKAGEIKRISEEEWINI